MTRSGVILVSIMIVTALAAMVAAGLLFRMTASASASAAMENGEQARQAAMSAIVRTGTVLGLGLADMDTWYDNPDLFHNQKVFDDGTNTWYFTVYAPDPTDATKVRYGLIDESGKININTATESELRSIPILSDEMVQCLLDYRDADDVPRELGAEQEYYDRLPFPYVIKNGPITTVEELLMVKGFDASVIYGEDTNLNGLMEANENDADKTFPIDNMDGQLDTGLVGLATTVSYTPSLTADGEPRTNVNGDAADLIAAGIPYDTVVFIRAYRKDGHTISNPAMLLNAKYQLRRDQKLWDGTQLNAGDWIESHVGEQELPVVMDTLDSSPGGIRNVRPGLINVNTAPPVVLASVDGIDQPTAETIATVRQGLDGLTKSTIAWLYTQGVMDEKTFKAVAPKLTARSYQYTIKSVGFGVPCGRICVLQAVVDIGRGKLRILYLRDLTRLGMPLPIDTEALKESGS